MRIRELAKRGVGALPAVRRLVVSPWGIIVLVTVAALFLTCKLNSGRDAEREARRSYEAELLRAKGLVVAWQKKDAELKREIEGLERRLPELQAEVARVKREARGARPVAVFSGSTGPVSAAGTARPTEPPPSSGAATAAAGSSLCLLAAGDLGEIRAEQVILDTRAGNRVMAAVASAWRVSPLPETRLFGGPLRGDFSVAKERPPPGWGVGGFGAVCGDGWFAGPAAALPPARFWGRQIETQIGAGFGSAGFGATGSAILRW